MTTSSRPFPPSDAPPPTTRDGRHDFDFLHGRWRVHNRRRRRPLSGSNDWDEFEGRTVEHALWDGQANLEEYEADGPAGPIRGLALRLYDPRARQWTIHWSNAVAGTLDPPMVGDFRDGRGVFFGHDACDGRAVLARFDWTVLGPAACEWRQAFSPDGGQTWETNWIMEFTRAVSARAGRATQTPPSRARRLHLSIGDPQP